MGPSLRSGPIDSKPTPSTPVPTSSRGHVYGLHGQYEAAKSLVSDAAALPLVSDAVYGFALGQEASVVATRRNLRIAVDLLAVAGGIGFGLYLLKRGQHGAH